MRYQGNITRWNEAKGFGFVTPNGGSQTVFLQARAFINRQRSPDENARVSYELGSDAKGRCCAVNVRYADEKPATIALRISVLPMIWVVLFVALLVGATLVGAMLIIVPIVCLVLSLITFLASVFDKSAAESACRRTPESTLFLFGLIGGWPGAILAQQLFRHKSSKHEFQTTFWMTVVLNCGGLIWLTSASGAGVREMLSRML